jgi:thioredoxin reductase
MNIEAQSGTWDCIVVGAGPAGLNAALVLGRARRRVLVLDNAQPRNYATHEMHGVLGHDGLDPADLRARGRAELGRYGVEVVTAEVQDAEVLDGAVRLTSARGADLTRTVLLATGMLDEVPDIRGFADLWGTSAHTCPYCDGFEHRDERLAVLAAGARGEHLAVLLRQWSDDVVLLSNGPHDLAADQLARVHALGIPIIETPVVALDGDGTGRLRRVRLDNGETLDRDALFFYVGWRLRVDVARTLGCRLRDDGSIAVDSGQATTVDRVYAAGNCAEPRALVPAAAGSGVTAAVAINTRLSFEDADRAVDSRAGARLRGPLTPKSSGPLGRHRQDLTPERRSGARRWEARTRRHPRSGERRRPSPRGSPRAARAAAPAGLLRCGLRRGVALRRESLHSARASAR